MDDLLRKKEYKKLKKDVNNQSAIGIGYFNDIFNYIPEYALFDAIRSSSELGWIREKTTDADLRNILVTESIKKMNYQDFKVVAPYLFSFPREKREAFLRVQPIEISRENFDYLQSKLSELIELKADIERLNNSIDSRIETLEMNLVPNGDRVIGINEESEELLLLRTPENSYIEDWEVENPHQIIDFKSSKTASEQILDYFSENYPELKPIFYEHVLDNDLYNGYADVDKDSIEEIDVSEIPNFDKHSEFYSFAVNYPSFLEKYSSFEHYIIDRYNFIYEYNLSEYEHYADDILYFNYDAINKALEKEEKELVLRETHGYSQGDVWQLAYVRNIGQESIESVEYYLEHELGAWCRNSLSELVIIPFSSFENGVYTGQNAGVYHIDNELINRGLALDKIKEIYLELSRFDDIQKTKEKELQSIEFDRDRTI